MRSDRQDWEAGSVVGLGAVVAEYPTRIDANPKCRASEAFLRKEVNSLCKV